MLSRKVHVQLLVIISVSQSFRLVGIFENSLLADLIQNWFVSVRIDRGGDRASQSCALEISWNSGRITLV